MIEITINSELKAKVANLLNRLKEQLYKLRLAQHKDTKSTPTIGLLEDFNHTLVAKGRVIINEKEATPTTTSVFETDKVINKKF